MKISNKIELKKMIILSITIMLISTILFTLLSYSQYKRYTLNFNKKINAIISIIKEKYPNITNLEVSEILNNNIYENEKILRSYGIDIYKDSILLENNYYYKLYITLNLIFIITIQVLLLITFLIYNKRKNSKLKEITQYIEEINNKNYSLKIEDNTEDELSILQNEIYKTTIMLREIAQNATKDKTNLKDSLSDISHQLKTPLTSINIMLDNILDNPNMDSKIRSEFIKDIKREIANITFLVNSLLKLSKFDVNAVNFVNKEEYIKTILDESIKNISMLCDLKNITITVLGNNTAKVNCDLKWQIEAITNILKNCIEHSSEDSNININYEENKIYSKIEIRDSGSGIEKEDLPHIFERFYKSKNSLNDSMGIGLALAKSIIENDNGYINVESQKNLGTTFTIKYLH